ncbi:MAG: hypothetical protein JO035_07540 [Betaproteobacteria bacterium]|nr:hypothetical protein [Betaproteobacteria bacterium]
MKKSIFLSVPLALAALAPLAALAQHFEAVDTIPLATGGRFPAYGLEPPRPLEVYIRGSVIRDNNLFRLSSAANTSAVLGTDSKAETVTRAGVGLRGENLIIGRQRFRYEASLDNYQYQRFTVLNHNEYGVRGEWLWELTNDLAGTAGYEQRQRLVDLAQRQSVTRDLILEQHAFLTGAFMLGPTVRLRGGLDGAKASHSDVAANAATVRTTTATAGIDYVTPLGNAIGIEARRTQGNAPLQEPVGPTAILVDNDFTEKEIAGVLTWTASPQLHAVGRLGRTQRNHVQFPQRDFSGNTGRLNVDWVPFNKTGFEFAAYKEPRTVIDIAASYVLVTGVSVGPRWAPTEKLVFTAFLISERQDFKGDPTLAVVPGAIERQETIRGLRLGASWEPLRMTQVQLGIDHGIRTSNVFLRDYNYTALMLNLRLTF